MRVKLFTLRYSATLGGFDDSALTEYSRDREVLAFREHFFSVADVPHLACVVLTQDAVVGQADLAAAKELRATRAAEQAAARQPGWCPAPDDEHRARSRRRPPRRRGSSSPDPTEDLSEPDRALFNTLRDWRAATAREEGVPPFLVFTNRHLLEIIAARPESANALLQLDGIGPGKVKRYGQQLLGLLHGGRAPPAAEAAAAAETETETVAGPEPSAPEAGQ